MSADRRGQRDGRRDAELHCANNLPRRPNPKLVASLLSDRYRLAYMTTYNRVYDYRQKRNERAIDRELAQNSKLITGEQVPRDKMFERGWRDGYDGKDTPPKGLSHDEVKTYERGHRSGNQHREWDLARRLRQQTRGR
ncbi:hypothetical protein [Nioella sp. MMSF_3534]|uniref:hypothetical protein n=1 Tax=Nioella sp. MMSF_3534 TaxID=3046720 RepID=UPI00273F13BF|nr:hypothetical protein [Nioella sp. MMSF_3534]